jgi:hypothetical protein
MLGNNPDQPLFELKHVFDLALHVARLPLGSTGDLMDHDVGIGECVALAFSARAQQHRSHARGHAEAIGSYIAREKLHCVVDRQTCGHRPTGELI